MILQQNLHVQWSKKRSIKLGQMQTTIIQRKTYPKQLQQKT
jgi:hypothetical protein